MVYAQSNNATVFKIQYIFIGYVKIFIGNVKSGINYLLSKLHAVYVNMFIMFPFCYYLLPYLHVFTYAIPAAMLVDQQQLTAV